MPVKAIVVIPARYSSTRFPGKLLQDLGGKPIIIHVYENSKKAKLIDDVVVATDDKRIYDTVKSWNGNCVMTSSVHLSGTDRIAEVARAIDCDIIVNVQGDEPFIRPEMVDDVVSLLEDERASISTLIKEIKSKEELLDPNIVKVVFDSEGFAIYFSRSPIPYHRDEWKDIDGIKVDGYVYKHIGIYGYKKDVLFKISSLPQSRLERIEKLEQLRSIENGIKIKVKETIFETIGIDTPDDLERAKRWLSISS